jgi:tetratricopeptide (TPR) repeat protein
MKLILLFLLLFSITAFGQADSLESRANELLQKAKTQELSKDELLEVRVYGTTIQNHGFILEEKNQDYEGSLIEINKSLNIWYQVRDTFRTANLLKYKGYLLGHLNQFSEAKIKIDSAIYLFRAVNYSMGVAVSQLDLSKVYEQEHNLDSALKYASITISYWKMQKDTFRIMTSGNQAINLLLRMKRYDLASDMQQELRPMIAAANMYWQPVLEFYFLSIQLFKKTNQQELIQQYQGLYQDKIKSLMGQNIIPAIRFGQYPD